MMAALEQAAKGIGLTRPNPPVGAVIVKNGRIIGRGWHRKAGRPHAEIEALESCGWKARGSTFYVTLEPCSTHGRTPPCTASIIKSGAVEVVYGVRDPNPDHAGGADAVLRKAGIRVRSGVCREEAEALIAAFASRIERNRPWVTLKLAMTLDGAIADRKGQSKWITGVQARKDVQALRRTADAVMVGAATVRHDDPSLMPRPAKGRKPWRVILDGETPLDPDYNVFTDSHTSRTILFTAHEKQVSRMPVEVVVLPAVREGLPLPKIMKELAARDIMHMVCEGGGRLAGNLVRKKLVDRFVLYYAPSILGGDAVPGFGGTGYLIDRKTRLEIEDVERLGDDLRIRARPASDQET